MAIYRYQHGDRPLEGYTIQHALGRGGFGEVYYAVSDSGREVALKSVTNYEDIELRGIKHCMNLKHAQLVSIFDIRHNEQGQPFVLMEYVDGPSLREILDAHPDGLGAAKSAFFLREIAKGLAYLHDNGIVHRDLKPHNVFYEQGVVKIGDYSLSKMITTSHRTGHSVTVGTVHYMAPEISLGRYDHAVDVYALGVLLFEMLTGRPPFLGDSMGEVLMKHVAGVPDVSGIEQPFARVIKKALSKKPEDRYATAQEMVDDLLGHEGLQDSLAALAPESLTMVAERSIEAAKGESPSNQQAAVTEPYMRPTPPPPPTSSRDHQPIRRDGRQSAGRLRPMKWIGFGILFIVLVRLGGMKAFNGPVRPEPSKWIFIALIVAVVVALKKKKRRPDEHAPHFGTPHHRHSESPPPLNPEVAPLASHTVSPPTAEPVHAAAGATDDADGQTTDSLDVSPFGRLSTLILSAIPFFIPIAGLHRFYVGRVGTGVVWLCTWGLFGIGTVVDMIMISLGQFRDAEGRRILNFTKETFDLQQPVNEYSAVAQAAWTESRIGFRLGNLFLNLVAAILLVPALIGGALVAIDAPGAVSTGVFGREVSHEIVEGIGIEDWDKIAQGVISMATVLAGTIAAGCLIFARRDTTWTHLFRVPFAVLCFTGCIFFVGLSTQFGHSWHAFADRVNDQLIGSALTGLFHWEFWISLMCACVLFVLSVFVLAWPARARYQQPTPPPVAQERGAQAQRV